EGRQRVEHHAATSARPALGGLLLLRPGSERSRVPFHGRARRSPPHRGRKQRGRGITTLVHPHGIGYRRLWVRLGHGWGEPRLHGYAGARHLPVAVTCHESLLSGRAGGPGHRCQHTSALRADEARSRDILARIPAGRWGQPADIGGAAVFLAAPASDYVHGAIIPVDGGWLAR